jgi:hypothetical protein
VVRVPRESSLLQSWIPVDRYTPSLTTSHKRLAGNASIRFRYGFFFACSGAFLLRCNISSETSQVEDDCLQFCFCLHLWQVSAVIIPQLLP